MNPVHVPSTHLSAMNGTSSTTNGDVSARITDQTHIQHQPQLQPGNSEKFHSISAGMCPYMPFTTLHLPLPTFRFPDEIALYDRQIRLWGVRAQER